MSTPGCIILSRYTIYALLMHVIYPWIKSVIRKIYTQANSQSNLVILAT